MARIEFVPDIHRDGACGTWSAIVLGDGGVCAAMRLPVDPADQTTVERVLTSIRAVIAARVSGVAPIADVAVGGNQVWTFVGIAPGPSVADLINDAILTPTDAAHIALDSGRALAGLHGHGLVHGAFSLRTVVVSRTGVVRVTEAGLAPALATTEPANLNGNGGGAPFNGFGASTSARFGGRAATVSGATSAVRADVEGWAATVRLLAGHVRRLRFLSQAVALEASADVAQADGLVPALVDLEEAAHTFHGYPNRVGLHDVMLRYRIAGDPDPDAVVRAIDALFEADPAIEAYPDEFDGQRPTVRVPGTRVADAAAQAFAPGVDARADAGTAVDQHVEDAPDPDSPDDVAAAGADIPSAAEPADVEVVDVEVVDVEVVDAEMTDIASDEGTRELARAEPFAAAVGNAESNGGGITGARPAAAVAAIAEASAVVDVAEAGTETIGAVTTVAVDTDLPHTNGPRTPTPRGPRRTSVIPPRRPASGSDDTPPPPTGLWKPKVPTQSSPSLRPAGLDDSSPDVVHDMRYGRGVPASNTRRPVPARLGRPAWWPRLAVNIALAVAIVLGISGYAVWRLDRPLHITTVSLTVQKHFATACQLEADVVGTVITSGGPGTFKYQWLRSDGTTTGVYSADVADASRPTEVHLEWTFSGSGRETAEVALIVLEPQRREASTSFEYICGG
ncbi:MAG TPA: hypothetical protein VKB59_18770 [Micromonosporaceae bacterium]|nr:hypothetical protein [Micromonosporaceae bacterium]